MGGGVEQGNPSGQKKPGPSNKDRDREKKGKIIR